jgi:hypothetical protein
LNTFTNTSSGQSNNIHLPSTGGDSYRGRCADLAKSDISVEAEVGCSVLVSDEEVVDEDELLRRVKRIRIPGGIDIAETGTYDGIKHPFAKAAGRYVAIR